ncbi:MAG: hypothetical protein Q6363_003250 [Candidatus Njordarchaeota archaeon]
MVLDTILTALSSPFSILILYLLDRYGEMKLTEILAKIGFSKYKSIRNTILLLSKAGLISVGVKLISPRVRAWKIKLTKLGKNIVKAILSTIEQHENS